jgi:hypothetical protein
MAEDPDQIYAAIERRKRRAVELGVPEFVWDLFERVKFYPSYSRNDPVGYQKFIPSGVTALEEPAKGDVAFVYDGSKYSFSWSTKNADSFLGKHHETVREDARLVLRVEGERVFELALRGEQTFYEDDVSPKTWEKREIQAFVEGPWVENLRELNGTIIQHYQQVHEAEARKRREDPRKLADLKDRFGIK